MTRVGDTGNNVARVSDARSGGQDTTVFAAHVRAAGAAAEHMEALNFAFDDKFGTIHAGHGAVLRLLIKVMRSTAGSVKRLEKDAKVHGT